MKKLGLFALIFLPFFLAGQSINSDTVFLKKGEHHSIFIDTNPHAAFYNDISEFTFDPQDPSYTISLDYFKDNKIQLEKRSIGSIPTKWVAAYRYQDNFYVYKPCDFLFHFQIGITDTAFIEYTGEGPVANKIVSFRKTDPNTFTFGLTGIYDKDRQLVIHIIDDKKGIAVFEDRNENGKRFFLMINADKIRQVPVIVNNCKENKQSEFAFEEKDVSVLLKTRIENR